MVAKTGERSRRVATIWPRRLSRNFTGHFTQAKTQAFRNPDPGEKEKMQKALFSSEILTTNVLEKLIPVSQKAL